MQKNTRPNWWSLNLWKRLVLGVLRRRDLAKFFKQLFGFPICAIFWKDYRNLHYYDKAEVSIVEEQLARTYCKKPFFSPKQVIE
tara:strand:+ start:19588 stop:19839 length:252 start_codon:yes stop_codon:yes gene_type:complete